MAPLDKLVTGLEALQMTPQAKMQHPMKIVDDSFHWSDKAFNVIMFHNYLFSSYATLWYQPCKVKSWNGE